MSASEMSVMAAVSGPVDSILDLTPPSGPLPEGTFGSGST
jgi:hypothetical protein